MEKLFPLIGGLLLAVTGFSLTAKAAEVEDCRLVSSGAMSLEPEKIPNSDPKQYIVTINIENCTVEHKDGTKTPLGNIVNKKFTVTADNGLEADVNALAQLIGSVCEKHGCND